MNEFKDVNKKIIKAGDVIYNSFNNPNYEKIIEINGLLCFEDGSILDDRYQTEKFWKISNR
jgi:hypothetical protein